MCVPAMYQYSHEFGGPEDDDMFHWPLQEWIILVVPETASGEKEKEKERDDDGKLVLNRADFPSSFTPSW